MSKSFHIRGARRLALCGVLVPAALVSAVNRYVDPNSPTDGPGNDWPHAFHDLQDALAVADGNDTIFVADGVYKAGTQTSDKFSVIGQNNQIKILGSHRGYNTQNLNPDAQDLQTFPSILSGDLNNDDAGDLTDPSNTTLDDNTQHIVWFDGSSDAIDSQTLFDSFVVTGAHATAYAGGMVNWVDSSPTIRHIEFRYNIGPGGGGMQNYGETSGPIISQCTFYRNVATNDGGGIFHHSGGTTDIVNCQFIENRAGHVGGAIDNRVYPYCPDPEGECFYFGGLARLSNCLFVRNRANHAGGGMRAAAGSRSILVNCTFVGNIIGPETPPVGFPSGGGGFSLGSDGGSPDVRTSELHNCIFWDNQVDQADGGPDIAVCGAYPGSLAVSFCDVPGGEDAVFQAFTCPPCCAPGCTPSNGCLQSCLDDPVLTWGYGNIDTDPLFTNASSDDYTLQSGSPCINTGDCTALVLTPDSADLNNNSNFTEELPLDYALHTRKQGRVDMGAYESSVVPCPADVTGDGHVNVPDLLAVIAQWGQHGAPSGDVAPSPCGDGVVGVADLLLVITHWGECNQESNGPPRTIQDCIDLCGLDQNCLDKCTQAVCANDPSQCN